MPESDSGQGWGGAASGWSGWLGRLWATGRRVGGGSGGPERETALIVAKSALAATLAWVFAERVLHTQYPAFAPFAAVLMVQATVYQSVLHSLRLVAAVVLGVSLQGLLGFVLNTHVWTFAVVALLALLIGQWRHLGSQGSQVVTAAFFAYSAFTTTTQADVRLSQLGTLMLLVVVGAVIGVAVNIALVPPMRYRSAAYGIASLATTTAGLLDDMCTVLGERVPEEGEIDDWQYRASELRGLVGQVREGISSAEESVRWNPRRLLMRQEPPFLGYRNVVNSLAGLSAWLESATHALRRTRGEPETPHTWFLAHYGDFLAAVSGAVRALTDLDAERLTEQARRLSQCVEACRTSHQELTQAEATRALNLADESRVYGGLLLDAERMVDELDYLHNALARGQQRRRTRLRKQRQAKNPG